VSFGERREAHMLNRSGDDDHGIDGTFVAAPCAR
jgi:hypothetical protein